MCENITISLLVSTIDLLEGNSVIQMLLISSLFCELTNRIQSDK